MKNFSFCARTLLFRLDTSILACVMFCLLKILLWKFKSLTWASLKEE